jgi:TrmH family RNA methyltransferase
MITSTQNPRVQAAARLHRRRNRSATGHTLIEGPSVVGDAMAAGVTIVDAFYLEDDDHSARVLGDIGVAVSPQVLAKVAPTEHPRGPVAVIAIPGATLEGRDTIVVVCVREPGNAGTIIRTAAGLGYDVLATPGTVDVWSPKVLRAGAGGHFLTSVVTAGPEWLGQCRAAGLRLAALVADGGSDVPAREEPMALLVGEEAAGLPEDVVADSDDLVTLPMPGGTESLNAAIAAAIAMYERWKTR